MDPHAFVAEVYRRMSLRHGAVQTQPPWGEVQNDPRVVQAAHELSSLLPSHKHAAILDLGFGRGWFLAACLRLGYTNLSGADFGIANKAFVKAWAPDAITLHQIEDDIGSFLASRPERYDFVHLSHVIEHIPKYSLLWVVDALYRSLKPGGVLMLRTPNMESPCANSALYVTLAHEYGFCGSNLKSLLDICGFDDIRFHQVPTFRPTLKQRVGIILRWPFLKENQIKHRLFGVNVGGQFGDELVVTARRGDVPPLFDPKYR
ncbi:MAG: class I SAM-dependent methyltransferase [Acidobacteriia bacterium]|nr:class I SAM-dependent methyltransferase [Terriglobia bacterium]